MVYCRWGWFRLFLILAAAILPGCQIPVGVTRVDAEIAHQQLTRNVLSTGEVSRYTAIVLHLFDLKESYFDNPRAALQQLHDIFLTTDRSAPVAFALAELSFLYAKKTNQPPYYLSAAMYAYLYLFPKDFQTFYSPFDPRVRIAADLYNLCLPAGLISQDRSTMNLQSGTYTLPFGTLQITLPEANVHWNNRKLTNFIPVANFAVQGLQNRYRQAGIGVPLAAQQIPQGPEEGLQIAKGKLPVTAFLRFHNLFGQLEQGSIHGDWEIYNAYDNRTVKIDGRDVPLEIEFTAVLAASLAESPIWARELKGFFLGDLLSTLPSQLVAFEPYRPGRIPVVLVHGTASGPGRWADMLNDLAMDPAIGNRFQFWFFSYDTGNPIVDSAAALREALQQAVQQLEKKYQDPALNAMVIIGHSQGGLLAKLTAVDSGTILWDAFSNKSPGDMKVSNQTRELLQRSLFVKPLPFVTRLIFIATPHHGSYVSGSWAAHQLAKFIKLPGRVVSGVTDIVTQDFSALKFNLETARLGSVFGMEPGSPLMTALAAIPLAPGVSGHSIIAVKDDGPLEEANDGVVAYRSAHMEGMESEFIVRSGHSCQSNPHTIQEVRRILLLHAQQLCSIQKMCN